MTGTALNAVALAVLGWVGWDAWNSGILQGMDFKVAPVAAEKLNAEASRVDINSVIRAHLFGQESKVRQVVKKTAPPTRLNLKLVGVIATGSDGNAFALVEVSRGRQEVIGVGQPIGKTGARLTEVAGDHILIERNGQLEKLSLIRPDLESGSLKAPKPLKSSEISQNQVTETFLPEPSDGELESGLVQPAQPPESQDTGQEQVTQMPLPEPGETALGPPISPEKKKG